MSLIKQHGWWIVSIIDAKTLIPIRSDIDAVFADGADDAQEQAGLRNPRRINELFGLNKATTWTQKRAVTKHTNRSADIEEFRKMMLD